MKCFQSLDLKYKKEGTQAVPDDLYFSLKKSKYIFTAFTIQVTKYGSALRDLNAYPR